MIVMIIAITPSLNASRRFFSITSNLLQMLAKVFADNNELLNEKNQSEERINDIIQFEMELATVSCKFKQKT